MNPFPSTSRSRVSYYSIQIGITVFRIDSRYQNITSQGDDSHGYHTVSAFDTLMNRMVSIKKIRNLLSQQLERINRLLREIILSRHFTSHENILSIYDIMTDPPDTPYFIDLYLVTNLFESDLDRIIKSKQSLSDHHHQFFIYQILRALKFIHSANVVHCILNPSNLLVNSDCDLAIDGLGMARVIGTSSSLSSSSSSQSSSRYWYQAPEILLHDSDDDAVSIYSKPSDIWSCGCILAELITQAPFFYVKINDGDEEENNKSGGIQHQQFKRILNIVGCPSQEKLGYIQSKTAQTLVQQEYIQQQLTANNKSGNNHNAPHFALNFPSSTSFLALDLLKRMLAFCPEDRITVEDALAHPYLKNFHGLISEPVCTYVFHNEDAFYGMLRHQPLSMPLFSRDVSYNNIDANNHQEYQYYDLNDQHHHQQQQPKKRKSDEHKHNHDNNNVTYTDARSFTNPLPAPILSSSSSSTTSPVLPLPQPIDQKFGDFLAQAFLSSVFQRNSTSTNMSTSNDNKNGIGNNSSTAALVSSSSSKSLLSASPYCDNNDSNNNNSNNNNSIFYSSGMTSSQFSTPRSAITTTSVKNNIYNNNSSCPSSCRTEIDENMFYDEMNKTATSRSDVSASGSGSSSKSMNNKFNNISLNHSNSSKTNNNNIDNTVTTATNINNNHYGLLTKQNLHRLILQEVLLYRLYMKSTCPDIDGFIMYGNNNSDSSSKTYNNYSYNSINDNVSVASSLHSSSSSSKRLNDQQFATVSTQSHSKYATNEMKMHKSDNYNNNNNTYNTSIHNNNAANTTTNNNNNNPPSMSFATLAEIALKAILQSTNSSSSSSVKSMNDGSSYNNSHYVGSGINSNKTNTYTLDAANKSASNRLSNGNDQEPYSRLSAMNPKCKASDNNSLSPVEIPHINIFNHPYSSVTTFTATTIASTSTTTTSSSRSCSKDSTPSANTSYDGNEDVRRNERSNSNTNNNSDYENNNNSNCNNNDNNNNNNNSSSGSSVYNMEETMELAIQLLLEPEWYENNNQNDNNNNSPTNL